MLQGKNKERTEACVAKFQNLFECKVQGKQLDATGPEIDRTATTSISAAIVALPETKTAGTREVLVE